MPSWRAQKVSRIVCYIYMSVKVDDAMATCNRTFRGQAYIGAGDLQQEEGGCDVRWGSHWRMAALPTACLDATCSRILAFPYPPLRAQYQKP